MVTKPEELTDILHSIYVTDMSPTTVLTCLGSLSLANSIPIPSDVDQRQKNNMAVIISYVDLH